ncbi:hypothetical protein BDP27DRAFT_1316583 [Rhodocollybia butyracea]|uniref:Rap-GAP domain-containing protein n=1 Tax=Rhodocollybia butyracea TaxID=206335 RepID=A0A9P5Q4Q6_9AGAR|nr:hypothetical protein BDP27DRAFT_1316583 [Rhodocollybia butyracea]
MPGYRRPLANLVFEFCRRVVAGEPGDSDYCDVVWKILADEVVLRIFENGSDDEELKQETSVETIVAFLTECASAAEPGIDDDEEEGELTTSFDVHGPSSPQTHIFASPTLSRVQSEVHPDIGPSRSQSLHPSEDFAERPSREPSSSSYPILALSSLISIFSQLCFTPHAPPSDLDYVLRYLLRIFQSFTSLVIQGKSTRVRIATLQFLMRLRADRDHKIYFRDSGYDQHGQVAALSALINRTGMSDSTETPPPTLDAVSELRKARARARMPPSERDMRGRGGGPSQSFSRNATSRSRSRVGAPSINPVGAGARLRNRPALWRVPEQLPFSVSTMDTSSEILGTYDPSGQVEVTVLPISEYLSALLTTLESEKSWDILSYVLCHLPVQLANKHLFCGPKSKVLISKILTTLCMGILEGGSFARSVERWPNGIKLRDAHGLVYHTLSVLVSYKKYFDTQQRHSLVNVFLGGLSGQPATIICCIHALAVSAYELQSSAIRYLSDILEKLSQIMSNPDMAVHILSFLSVIGSQPPLYSNFIEKDYKMVFGLALQYLQHHNRMSKLDSPDSPMSSWALSQHVRIISYHLVYVWFLAVKLPDRPKYLRYITRQLLLANEGNEQVDDPTEVCFDWLARYTYASADPRPANSLLQDIVIHPNLSPDSDGSGAPRVLADAASEKTWLLGNSVVTIRALKKLGWIEILSRRPSGYTKFLGRLENVPLVGPGDVDPDMLTVPAIHLMDREFSRAHRPDTEEGEMEENYEEQQRLVGDLLGRVEDDQEEPVRPDPLSGYVWSGTAPSQRRKDVTIDPSFFPLQLSSYPDRLGPSNVRMLVDSAAVSKFTANLDRVPVIDTHKVGIMYVAPGQTTEVEILRNTHGSPAYTRFLEGLGRLINLRGQIDVYAGGLDPGEDGEYAYAWWDDIGQILYHTATMMPCHPHDESSTLKKRHIGNDYVRIVWNDSGIAYRFDTLATQFQFVNIVIEPHSVGTISAYSNNVHETEYFKVTVQRAEGMIEFAPVGHYKLVSVENLPFLVRELSLLADWFAYVFARTDRDTLRVEVRTNWQERLSAIRRFKDQQIKAGASANGAETKGNGTVHEQGGDRIMAQEAFRDFTSSF